MNIYDFLLWWFVLGVIGVCIVSYVDGTYINNSNDDTKWLQPHVSLFEYILVSAIGGAICLAVGLYALYFKITNKG